MPLLGRRGFTLVEMMIALLLLGMVSAAVYQVLVNNQRLYMAQTQQIDLNQNLRAAAAILPAEFREIDAADGDITAMSATSITFRAMRKLAFICVPPVLGGGLGQISMTLRNNPIFGRNTGFNVNDSLLVFDEGSATTRNDDIWLPAQIKGAVAGVCPDNGANNPGVVITMQPQWLAGGLNVSGAISYGSPVRGFDNVTYSLYQNTSGDGDWYLGQTNNSSGGTIQPIVGPLTGSAGLELDYFDVNGAVTAVNTQVALIEIHLRAQTSAPVRQGGTAGLAYKVDSITARVALRNNPRCGNGSSPFTPC